MTQLHFPATARNREPILGALRSLLDDTPSTTGLVLEIGSGSGEHAAYFAPRLEPWLWQPSDPEPEHRDSIAAWRDGVGCPRLLAPLAIDAASPRWPIDAADIVFAANVIHVAPWSVSEGLVAGAGRVLSPGGALILYGPFFADDLAPAPSNRAFDENLRRQDPQWGVRHIGDLERLARRHGLDPGSRMAMPANNLVLAFRKLPISA